LVYCTDKTFFWTPFSRLALAPEFGSSLLFPQILGMTVANEMLLMSKQLPAKRAFELGLVSAVFPEAGFLDKVLSEVRAGLVYPMLDITLPLFKEMIRKRDLAKVEQAIEYELRILDERAERGEIAQAVVQFVQAEAKRREAKL
jgi:peroxisomal 3,2-trans-enoyl-CoA isomerase